MIKIMEGGGKRLHEVPFFVRVKIPFFSAAHNPRMPIPRIPYQTVQHTRGFSGCPSIRDATQQLTQMKKKNPRLAPGEPHLPQGSVFPQFLQD